MRGNDCDPLLAVSFSVSSMSSSVVITSSDMPSSSSLTTPQPTTITPSLSPVERVWSKILVIQEQAAEMERKTRYQSKYLSWYEERRCRNIYAFFGQICRRVSSTSPDSLVDSILNQCMYRSMPLSSARGKDNEDRALSAYEQERHERGHSSLEVTVSGLVINPEYSWLGASLDGVVHDPGCTDPNGLLEIKCPCNYRDSTPF